MKDRQLIGGTLAIIVTLATCALAGYLLFRPYPAANGTLINFVLGSLVTQFTIVVGYYFGSSRNAEKQPRSPITVPQDRKP